MKFICAFRGSIVCLLFGVLLVEGGFLAVSEDVVRDDARHPDARMEKEPEPTLHRPGRHVCSKQKIVTRPVMVEETYSRPRFHPVNKPCPGKNSKDCPDFKVVYETMYRVAKRMNVTKETVYTCCPGWEHAHKFDSSCLKARCSTECKNGGRCLAPDKCTCPSEYSGVHCEKMFPKRAKLELALPPHDTNTELSSTVKFLIEAIGVLEQRMVMLEKKINKTTLHVINSLDDFAETDINMESQSTHLHSINEDTAADDKHVMLQNVTN